MKNIWFLSTSNSFDSHISQFKKLGINSNKQKTLNNIENCDVLLIDLDLPKEQAYLFLQKIQSIPKYSDKIILAIISHKSQVKKLRSIALGCDGYISPSIPFPELHQKLRELTRPEKYLVSKKYEDIEMNITFEGQMTHISESGCLIKSSLSLDPKVHKININNKLIDDLKLSHKIVYQSSRSNPMVKRNFLSQINFFNLEEEDRLQIRKMIHGWNVQ
ncbi:response regulator [Bacteriovoracaceae bacterium]|nr:response regulator [Bacteriovoracaceae bacterium]